MQNDPRSHGLWEKTAPKAPPTTVLTDHRTTDVVIIGGGFTGLSAAYHLAPLNLKSIVLEAVEIGFGGAGRNVGLLNAGLWITPEEVIKVLGPDHGEICLDVLSRAPQLVRDIVEEHKIACELEKRGTLHLAVGRSGLTEITQRHSQWRARGAALELLDANETRRRTGSGIYAGALFDPRAGTIQPLAYVRGLARAAMAVGAEVYTQSPAISANHEGRGWLVKTERGSVSAKWIVVASDAYAQGPWCVVREEQVHLPYFNFATPPLSEEHRKSILPNREGCWDTKEILSSFRMDQMGRLIFGSVGALRNSGRWVHRAWAQRALKQVFPQLGKMDFECEWYGKIGLTTDATPRFHKFADTVVGFSGYNGRGIAPGTAFGGLLASYIAGKIGDRELPLPVTEAQPQSLRNIKATYYETGAQVAHLFGARGASVRLK